MSPTSRLTPRACAVAAALLVVGLPALAETGPWYIGARQTFTHDSNVYRTPEATSDWISSTGIFGGLDQQISRQRLRANVGFDWNRYRNEDRLNHSSGNGLVRLDWETIGNLSGDAQVSHNQNLYRDYTAVGDALNKTVVRLTEGQFNARLGVVTAWTLEAGVYGSRTRYKGSVSDINDIDYNGVRAGVRYNPRSHITIGLGARRADGEYPNASEALDFTRKDIDLLFGWRPTGTSQFDSRISRSTWDYAGVDARSNTFTTGSITYGYRPGGRWTLDAVFRRDDTAGQYGFDTFAIVGNQLVLTQAQALETRIVNTYGLSGTYQLTGKTSLRANLQRVERRLDNSISTSTTPLSGRDRTHVAGIEGSWDATRAIRVGCGVNHVKRSVSGDSGLTYPYSVNLVNCSAQIALQP